MFLINTNLDPWNSFEILGYGHAPHTRIIVPHPMTREITYHNLPPNQAPKPHNVRYIKYLQKANAIENAIKVRL